ncbi:MAG: hypothetical protein WCE72_16610, partial [Pseudolabrys sp.]
HTGMPRCTRPMLLDESGTAAWGAHDFCVRTTVCVLIDVGAKLRVGLSAMAGPIATAGRGIVRGITSRLLKNAIYATALM